MAGDRTASRNGVSDRDGFIATSRTLVEERLHGLVPKTGRPAEAARHTLLLPGKRLRALITLAAAELHGGDAETALDPACAVEMVHAASLIFDDLPAMDDARIRRGAETPHVLYGEDVAILAGIGLLNGAFGVLSRVHGADATCRSEMVRVLSDAVGWCGLVHGQALDLSSDAGAVNCEDVASIHHGKTGALFVASALLGAVVVSANLAAQEKMICLGRHLGQAYQAYDDVLDAVASPEDAGKPTGTDGSKGTAMALASGGAPEALARAEEHMMKAKAQVDTPDCKMMQLLDSIGTHFEKIITPAVSAA